MFSLQTTSCCEYLLQVQWCIDKWW